MFIRHVYKVKRVSSLFTILFMDLTFILTIHIYHQKEDIQSEIDFHIKGVRIHGDIKTI